MFMETRPTCVTVIGWAWIVIGVLGGLSALAGLVSMIAIEPVAPEEEHMVVMFVFPVLAISQVGIAVLAIVAGAKFLALKAWARTVLETLSWLAVVFLVSMALFMVFGSSFMGPEPMNGRGHMGGPGVSLFMLLIMAFYSAPFVIMLIYLRGQKVKTAMERSS